MQFRGLKSTHINEELMFVFFVCSDESAFRLNVAVAGKTLDSRHLSSRPWWGASLYMLTRSRNEED